MGRPHSTFGLSRPGEALGALVLWGVLSGAWFGFFQWLVLRKYISQAGTWIAASCIGLAVGAPLSWLAYAVSYRQWVSDPSGFLPFWLRDITFGVLFGLSIGVAQWIVLRQRAPYTKLWIIALPILFTLGIVVNDRPDVFTFPVIDLILSIKYKKFPESRLLDFDFLYSFFDTVLGLTLLVITSVLSGNLLKWLLQSSQQSGGQNHS